MAITPRIHHLGFIVSHLIYSYAKALLPLSLSLKVLVTDAFAYIEMIIGEILYNISTVKYERLHKEI